MATVLYEGDWLPSGCHMVLMEIGTDIGGIPTDPELMPPVRVADGGVSGSVRECQRVPNAPDFMTQQCQRGSQSVRECLHEGVRLGVKRGLGSGDSVQLLVRNRHVCQGRPGTISVLHHLEG